jgi:glyceraldehyde 3-phosphate dehydrogenase
MEQTFGVVKAMLTTVHAYTDDQNLHDNSQRDMRRARGAAHNIVPTSTGAARAVSLVLPQLKDRFDGLAIRVPVPVGSLSDMVFVTKRSVTVEEVNAAFIQASKTPHWSGILAVTQDPIVSSDIVGRSESSIVDLSLTQVVDGDLVKVVSWYDNEWGYCNRLVEQVVDETSSAAHTP